MLLWNAFETSNKLLKKLLKDQMYVILELRD